MPSEGLTKQAWIDKGDVDFSRTTASPVCS